MQCVLQAMLPSRFWEGTQVIGLVWQMILPSESSHGPILFVFEVEGSQSGSLVWLWTSDPLPIASQVLGLQVLPLHGCLNFFKIYFMCFFKKNIYLYLFTMKQVSFKVF